MIVQTYGIDIKQALINKKLLICLTRITHLEHEVLLAHILGRDFILNELIRLDESRKPAGVWANLCHHRLRIDGLPVLVHLQETGGNLAEVGLGIAGDCCD